MMGDARFDRQDLGAPAPLSGDRPRGAHFAPVEASAPRAFDALAVAQGAAGPRVLPPRPSDAPRSRTLNAVMWLLAAFGAFAAVLATQLLFTLESSVVVVVFSLAVNQSFSSDELISTYIGPIMLVSQMGCLAVFLPWWRHLRASSLIALRHPAGRPTAVSIAARLVAIALMGVGLQLILSYVLTFLLPLAPDLQTEYTEIIDDPVLSDLTVLSLLVTAIGAPVTEELACRGVIFECVLRAVCPACAARWRDAKWCRETGETPRPVPAVPPARFWIANALQALLFGVLHLNIVQGTYAFLLGMLFGWVVWRTGSLAWSMILHLAINFCSFFVVELSGALEFAGVPVAVVLAVLIAVAGLVLFSLASARSRARREGSAGRR